MVWIKKLEKIINVSPEFYRPAEVDVLGDPTKIEKELGWKREFSFENLVEDMCSKAEALESKLNIVVVSGGFDPIHSGHISYINAAKKYGDYLIIALNSDDWLIVKKGKKLFLRTLKVWMR